MTKGTLVTYTYAAGKVVNGKIIREYGAKMPGWFLVELYDEAGKYRGGCHVGQLQVR